MLFLDAEGWLVNEPLYVQWDGNVECLCLSWQPMFGTEHGVLYLVGAVSDVSNLPPESMFYATLDNSLSLSGISRSVADTVINNFSVLAMFANGSVTTAATFTATVPSAPSNAVLGEQYYVAAERRAYRNLTWSPGNDAFLGPRLYSISFTALDGLSECPPFFRTNHTGEMLQVRMITDLPYHCNYSITITPIVEQIHGLDTVGPLSLHRYVYAQFALAQPVLDYDNNTAQLNCHNGFNIPAAWNESFHVDGTVATYSLNFADINADLLLVPVNDLLGSVRDLTILIPMKGQTFRFDPYDLVSCGWAQDGCSLILKLV